MNPLPDILFEEVSLGASASLTRKLEEKDMEFLTLSSRSANDHPDDIEFAGNDLLNKLIAHDRWGGGLIFTLTGTTLPELGKSLLDNTSAFHAPAKLGDSLKLSITVVETIESGHLVVLAVDARNQREEIVICGRTEIRTPSKKNDSHGFMPPAAACPSTGHSSGQRYRQLLAMTKGMAPLRTAVVHPVDINSLLGAVEAAHAGLIIPLLVGPETRIRLAAKKAGIDISAFEIIVAEHSEEAASVAVALAREGKVEALMKGALHTDELMRAVVAPLTGLRTARRMSHVFAIDAPGYPRPLFITDAALTIYPTLEDKRDIVQNAIDLAHALGIRLPYVALLSAVETVTSSITSTLHAAALCKMAERGQITGGILDGPLAFDNAVSAESAATKGITSSVAGRADIFLVPDMEAGNMLAKQLEYLAGAEIAGIVLGARVPIMLTSRADKTLARMASCAIGLLLARHRGKEQQ